jgi:tRNA (cmo5U34)-methyltransferase
MSGVGDKIKAKNADWNFKGETALNFDEHVSKSVPFYKECHQLICQISDYFVKSDSTCYELGCSTGELTLNLARHNAAKTNAKFIGVDVEPDMIQLAESKKKKQGVPNAEFLVDDIIQMDLGNSDLIVAYYCVQFVRPSQRQKLIDKIYSSLNWGGAFLLFEKVRASDARFQDMMTGLYNDYKIAQGYSPEEIFHKSRSLKGVLEPFSTQGNLDMLKRANFVDTISVFKYVSFEGFLAIK